MLSSIKVHFRDDGKGLQPIIAVKLIDSDDPRDCLLKAFFQALGGKSSWLVAEFNHHIISDTNNATTIITIQPVREGELQETSNLIKDRISGKIASSGPVNLNPIKDNY